jgi:hypothetical protein
MGSIRIFRFQDVEILLRIFYNSEDKTMRYLRRGSSNFGQFLDVSNISQNSLIIMIEL